MTGDVTLGHLVTMLPARFLHNKVTVPPPKKKEKKKKNPTNFLRIGIPTYKYITFLNVIITFQY